MSEIKQALAAQLSFLPPTKPKKRYVPYPIMFGQVRTADYFWDLSGETWQKLRAGHMAFRLCDYVTRPFKPSQVIYQNDYIN